MCHDGESIFNIFTKSVHRIVEKLKIEFTNHGKKTNWLNFFAGRPKKLNKMTTEQLKVVAG